MDNDEKTASRGDETLPTNGDEPSLEERREVHLSEAAPKDGKDIQSAKTVPFPLPKAPHPPARMDDSFGIPDFGFAGDDGSMETEPSMDYRPSMDSGSSLDFRPSRESRFAVDSRPSQGARPGLELKPSLESRLSAATTPPARPRSSSAEFNSPSEFRSSDEPDLTDEPRTPSGEFTPSLDTLTVGQATSYPVESETDPAMPLKDGTGWETVGSIMKPTSLRARIEMQEVDDAELGELLSNNEDLATDIDLDADADAQSAESRVSEKAAAPRHDANVTPFPGTAVHRQAERAPAEMLRAGGSAAEIFGEIADPGGEEPAAPPLEAPSSNPDGLADAVQSALRNIYGHYSEQQDGNGDHGGYTVADALAGPDASPDGATWTEERGLTADWRQDAHARDDEADDAEEPGSEGVLDYLYSQRRQERAAPQQQAQPQQQTPQAQQLSPEMSLNDYAARTAQDDNWQEDEPDQDEMPRRVMPFPARGDRAEPVYRGRGPELSLDSEPSIMRGGAFYRDDEARPTMESEWGQPPYGAPQNARGTIAPTYAPAVATTAADTLPAQGPDSGHLLGAAGLGLIGGIALAGVLAVFVFNSFVDENGQTFPESNAKTVERLGPSQTASAVDLRPAPESRTAPEALALLQPAPVQPGPAAAAEPPAPAPVISAPQRAAALAPQPTIAAETNAKPKLSALPASGSFDAPFRLNIAVGNNDLGDALVSLKGLPKEARLSTGIDVGGGQWLLPPGRLKDLTVTAPASASGSYPIEAQLLKDDAQTSLSDAVPFTMNIAGPGAARPSPVQPAPIQQAAPNVAQAPAKGDARLALLPDEAPLPETDFLTQMLIRDGNKKMREGDIGAARRLYEQAAASGNPEAALAMGRSYDPTYFEKLTVKTGKPDPAQAFDWYKRALDGGLVTAKVKIDALKQWLQR